jgi:tryptophanyl-tRNA synthetase
MATERIVSGIKPTSNLFDHEYDLKLSNWIRLQHESECFFFVADLHSLFARDAKPELIEKTTETMIIDWLACGLDPAQATIFVQSKIPEHTEIFTLLSMITPINWLSKINNLEDTEKSTLTFGNLGQNLMQSADILLYRATQISGFENQIPFGKLTSNIVKEFNNLYGKDIGYIEKAKQAIKKLGTKKGYLYEELRTSYQAQGDEQVLKSAQSLIEDEQSLSLGDKERLLGYLEGGGKMILIEPEFKLQNNESNVISPNRKSKDYKDKFEQYKESPDLIRSIAADGCEKARKIAKDTMRDVREEMGIDF